MNKILLVCVVGLLIPVTYSATLRAQGRRQRPEMKRGRKMPEQMPMRPPEEPETKPFLETYDQDNDGVVSPAEYPGPQALFKLLDKNGDGKVSRDDLKVIQAKVESQRALQNPILFTKTFDKNGDGLIDGDEWPSFLNALKKLDKNGDGKLSPDELMGRPKPMETGIIQMEPEMMKKRHRRPVGRAEKGHQKPRKRERR